MMKQLLNEINDLTQEKEDFQKEYEQRDYCNPNILSMNETEFGNRLRDLINSYVKRLILLCA